MPEFLPPVVAQLKAEIKEYSAKLGEARADMKETSAVVSKSAEETRASWAAGGAAVGAAMMAVGGILTAQSEKVKRAHINLVGVIENLGFAYKDYRGEIDRTIKDQARYGKSSDDVQKALTNLTIKTKDPKRSLEAMGLVADIAALKNTSLAEASTLVSRALAGQGKALKALGVDVVDVKGATEDLEKAQKNQARASERLKDAQQRLADLQAIHADSMKPSISQTIQLREAEERLADARKSGDREDIKNAEQALADTRLKLADATKLSIPEQIALRDATAAVATAQAEMTTAQQEVTTKVAAADEATKKHGATLDTLKDKYKGLADEQAKTFSGRLAEIRARAENVAAAVGDKLGPALTLLGGLLSSGSALVTLLDSAWLKASISGGLLAKAGGFIAAVLTSTAVVIGLVVAAGVLLGVTINRLIEKYFPEVNKKIGEFGSYLLAPIALLGRWSVGMDVVKSDLRAVGEWLDKVKAKIVGFGQAAGTWLKKFLPGSPPPLAVGLMRIREQLKAMKNEFGALPPIIDAGAIQDRLAAATKNLQGEITVTTSSTNDSRDFGDFPKGSPPLPIGMGAEGGYGDLNLTVIVEGHVLTPDGLAESIAEPVREVLLRSGRNRILTGLA